MTSSNLYMMCSCYLLLTRFERSMDQHLPGSLGRRVEDWRPVTGCGWGNWNRERTDMRHNYIGYILNPHLVRKRTSHCVNTDSYYRFRILWVNVLKEFKWKMARKRLWCSDTEIDVNYNGIKLSHFQWSIFCFSLIVYRPLRKTAQMLRRFSHSGTP